MHKAWAGLANIAAAKFVPTPIASSNLHRSLQMGHTLLHLTRKQGFFIASGVSTSILTKD
jgi:hypothetical protein